MQSFRSLNAINILLSKKNETQKNNTYIWMCIWYFSGVFQVALMVKQLPASAGDEGLIPGSGRSSREYEMIAHSSSLFFFFFYFNWRIITLKYCGIFLTHVHESAMGLQVFSNSETLSHLPPSPIPWVVPEHQLWVSCFMHPTCTGHLFYIWEYTLSMLFSQIIPPSPSSTYSKSLFFKSVSLLLPCV